MVQYVASVTCGVGGINDHDESIRNSFFHMPDYICNDVASLVVVKYVLPACGRIRRSDTAVTFAALAPVIK